MKIFLVPSRFPIKWTCSKSNGLARKNVRYGSYRLCSLWLIPADWKSSTTSDWKITNKDYLLYINIAVAAPVGCHCVKKSIALWLQGIYNI